METYRLKNIAILILLLLNGFLLVLLGYQSFRSHRSAAETATQLRELYEARGLTLDRAVDLGQEPLTPLRLSGRRDAEQAIAAYLLGGDPVAASQGGGIISFATEYGSIQFRSGGSFYANHLTRQVEDPEEFSQTFCEQFGYEDMALSEEGGTVTVTAGQRLEDVPIAGCDLALTFEDGCLTAVNGAHAVLEESVPEAAERMTCVTALVRFLDYRDAYGVVCGGVTGVSCVYALQGDAALRLTPVWQVDTDTYTYFVDCAAGEVTRQTSS